MLYYLPENHRKMIRYYGVYRTRPINKPICSALKNMFIMYETVKKILLRGETGDKDRVRALLFKRAEEAGL